MKDIIKNLLPNFILKPVQDILKLLRKKRYINHKSTIAINYYDGIINLYKGNFTDDLLLNSGNYDETFSLLPFNFDRNIQSNLLAIPNNIYNGEI